MNPLTAEQLKSLLRAVDATRDQELNCSECQSHLGEFAETQLAGLPVAAALARVDEHLALCPECREEFSALQKVLRATQ